MAGMVVGTAPKKPAAPTTMVLNGQTYTSRQRTNAPQETFGGDDVFSDDHQTVWSPMQQQGGATSRLSARASGGAGEIPVQTPSMSIAAARSEAEQMLPTPPRAAVLPPRIVAPVRADNSAAEAASFARAKDRIGMTGQGAMKSLQSLMSRRGLAGSGIEGREMGDLVSGVRGQLGDVVRDQTIEGLRRDNAVEDRNYAGELGQRATDVGFETNTRGQDIQAAQGRASLMPSLLSLILRSGTGTAY